MNQLKYGQQGYWMYVLIINEPFDLFRPFYLLFKSYFDDIARI